MDIVNRDKYYNSIYKGYIINDSTGDDPDKLGRYQIYIPQIHYTLIESNIEEYNKLSSEEKKNSFYFNSFPWAISLVSGLSNGDIIYGSYIENNNNAFVILGKLDKADGMGGFDGEYSIGADAILDLAMPIIIENEVGINRNNWPDGISDSQYGNVNSNDNGAWSIGLIQWHGCRAFDILYQIASKDSNWTSKWSDQSLSIVSDLQSAVKSASASPKRNNWNVTMYNSTVINGTRAMLTSSIGKETQREFARSETKVALDKLMDSPYGITNPAILIFCMDIMNQYGNGVNSVISGCLEKAATISKDTNLSMMQQLEEFRNWWKNRTNKAYETRRKNTYDYLVALEKEGKLSALTFIDLTELAGFSHIPEYGEYFWPTTASDQINCMYGDYTSSKKAAKGESTAYATYNGFKYNWAGLDHGTFHWGIDIAPKKGGVDGDALIACGSGEVIWVNSGGVDHRGSITTANPVKGPGQGNCIAIKMDKNRTHNFVYMHLCKGPTHKVGDKVKAGDVIGYMGSTGSSTGTHLHIGLHIDEGNNIWKTASTTSRPDPLPYFGKKATGVVLARATGSSSSSSKKSGSVTGQDIVDYAKTFLGCQYVWGATGPNTFDCSGLTYYVYKHFGYVLNRVSSDQRKNGVAVDKSNLQAGDLVHFTGHVGIYIANNEFIHAANSKKGVIISSLTESYYKKNYWGARRIL